MVKTETIVSALWLLAGALAGGILANLPSALEPEEIPLGSAPPRLLSPRQTAAHLAPWYPVAVKWRDGHKDLASKAAFEEAYRRIPLAPPAARLAALVHLADHWVRTNPYEALTFALERKDRDEVLMEEIFVALATHAPETVLARNDMDFDEGELAHWLRLAGGDDNRRMSELVERYDLERIAPGIAAFADPNAALQAAVALKDAEARRQAIGKAAVQWMLRHPESVMEALDRHVLEQDLGRVVTGLFSAASQQNLDFVMDHFEIFETHMNDDFYVRIGTALAYGDPDEAVALASRLAPGNPRQTYILSIAHTPGHLEPNHFEGLMDLVPSDADSYETYALAKLGAAWAQKDPEAAYRWADLNMPDPEKHGSIRSKILEVWYSQDPAEAMRHIDRLGDKDGWDAWPQFALLKAKQTLNSKGTDALRRFLAELPLKQQRMVKSAALFQGRPVSEKAMLLAEFADAQPPATSDDPFDGNRIREFEVTQALEAWASESPEEAVEWAIGQGNDSRLVHALTGWAEQDSGAALAEANRLGVQDQVRDHLAEKELTRMFNSESKIDFAEAYAKAEDLTQKGFNVPEIVERWVREDPEGALEVVAEKGREGMYRREAAERVELIRAIQQL